MAAGVFLFTPVASDDECRESIHERQQPAGCYAECMAYVKAAAAGLVAAFALGAMSGGVAVMLGALRMLGPEGRQVVMARGTSVAINDTILAALILVPLSLVVIAVRRRNRQRAAG